MEDTPRGGELAKTDRTPPVITNADEYRASVGRWELQRFHILTPFANISGLAASHGILTSVVKIDPEKTAGEAYDGLPFLKGGEVALAKNGLRRIAEGLGISTRLEYISVGVVQHYWHIKAIASYRGIDGAWVTREASMEWDLRDGSDRLKGWTANQIGEGRKYGLRACETRAINAAIRECGCGLKQSYKREELARPFVAVRVMFQPDLSDPETRRMVTQQALQGVNALYPSVPATSPVLPPADPFADHDEPRSIGSGSSAAAAQGSAAPVAKAVLTVVDVTEKSGTATSGRNWTVFRVSLSDGRIGGTFDEKMAAVARKAKDTKAPVDVVITDTGNGKPQLEEITLLGPAPSMNDRQMSLDDVEL